MAQRRFEELDGLRGVAAVWVVLYHLTSGLSQFWLRDRPGLAMSVAPFATNIEGSLAVDLFFIISGFVICMTVERSPSVFDFAASRFARLFPVYWAAVVISTVIGVTMPAGRLPVTIGQGIVNLTMLEEYVRVRFVDPSYWSLSVELGFYGLMAIVLVTGQRRRIEMLGLAWAAAAFASGQLPTYCGVSLPWRLTTGLALTYAPLFYAGILFYRIRTDRMTWWRMGGIALCLLMRAAFMPPVMIAIECAIFLTFALSVADKLPVLRARPLLFMGGISYSLYLVHQPLGFRLQLALYATGAPPALNLAATLAIVVAAAAGLTYAVERPGTRLLRRLYADWRAPVPAVVG